MMCGKYHIQKTFSNANSFLFPPNHLSPSPLTPHPLLMYPDFVETQNSVGPVIWLDQTFFRPKFFFNPQLFGTQNYFCPKPLILF